jgi:hypothetical protein
MNYTMFFMASHLGGAIAYQNTGDTTYLFLNLAVMGYALFQFMKVCVLVLSPNWDVELAYAQHIPDSWKLLHNATQALSVYTFYIAGWTFVSGFSALYLLVVAISLIITMSNVNLGDIEGDDE